MTAALAAVLVAEPVAAAGYRPAEAVPELCRGDLFADRIGTAGVDRFEGAGRPERLWGLAGPDRLVGSSSRASCLLGGDGDDRLVLGRGGGAAFGESGDDALNGAGLDDVLSGASGRDELSGAGGADVLLGGRGGDSLSGGEGDDRLTGGDGYGGDILDGGPGTDLLDGGLGSDTVDGGPGDDAIMAADGDAEVLDCGDGTDRVAADRSDVVVGCESIQRSGGALPELVPAPRAAAADGIVRIRFVAPERAGAGGYRVLATAGCRPGTVLAVVGAVRAGRRVRLGLRPPAAGWCAGEVRGALVLRREPGRPSRPLARVRFTVS